MGYNPEVGYSAQMRSLRAAPGAGSRALQLPLDRNLPNWQAFGPTVAAPIDKNHTPFVPYEFRRAYRPLGVKWYSRGAIAAFESEGAGSDAGYTPIGNLQYDYRWRTLNARDLRKNMGLPIQPLMIYRKTDF